MSYPVTAGWVVLDTCVRYLLLAPLYFTGGVVDILYFHAADTVASAVAATVVVYLAHGTNLRRPLSIRRPSVGQAGWVLVLVFPLIVATAVVDVGTVWVYDALGVTDGLPEARTDYTDFLTAAEDAGRRGLLAVLVCNALGPAVTGELLFRGVLGRGLIDRYGTAVGVVTTSLLFAVVHRHPVHSVVTFGYGVVLHVVYLTTRSLVAPILLHAANNAALSLLLWSVVLSPDPADAYTPAVGTTAASVFATAAILAVLVRTRTRWRSPDGSLSADADPPADARPVHDPDGRLGWVALAAVVGFAAATMLRV